MLEGNTIRISLQLIDGHSDRTLWAQPYDREYGNVLSLVSTIAREVAIALKANIEGGLDPANDRNIDSKAFDLYQRGLSLNAQGTPETVRKAHDLFSETIRIAPQFAPAYAWLGSTCLALGQTFIPPTDSLSRAKAIAEGRVAVEKALALDKNLVIAHDVCGAYLVNVDWNLKDAEKELREALRLNPGDANAQASMMNILPFVGKFEEALDYARKAEELDPLYWGNVTNVAWALFYLKRYDEAIARAQQSVPMDETSNWTWGTLGHCKWQAGRKQEAMKDWARMHELDGNTELARAFRELPIDAALQKWIDQSTTSRGPIYNNPAVAALCYEFMGKREQAILWLNRAFEIRDANLRELTVNPFWTDARKDPRVLQIIKKMGMEEYVRKD